MASNIKSSSSSSPKWTYDVFLSFRGHDTGKNFTDHLYAALDRKGIFTFRDDERLERGKSKLVNEIEESRFAIVVFSRNYADSKWCLEVLAKIVDCMDETGLTVLPIFYHVDPSDVRKQTGFDFGKAFAKHEADFGENSDQVKRWKNAMTEVANLSGWDVLHRHEAKLIQEIVDTISSKLGYRNSILEKGLVGISSRVDELSKYLGTWADDVRTIGISGMGGIGKTTVARVVYERLSHQFEGCSFIANVREVSRKQGLAHLQEQLLSQILMENSKRIWDVETGIFQIRNRLCRKKVLVILDDVDKLDQITSLVGEHDCFSPGSRIIITTRDKHLLMSYGVDSMYHAKELNEDEALHLFSQKAFKSDHPVEDFLELSKHVVNYAKGLPLALEVLGSFLFDRSMREWKSAVDRLQEIPDGEITGILQISFNGLQEREQKIFLEIACFFKGKKKASITRILNSCGLYADIGIEALVDKSLINISNNELWMHDLLQQMGREIVRQESVEEPGKRSRLWLPRDVYHVFMNNTGTQAVSGIFLDLFEDEEAKWSAEVQLSPRAFLPMVNLRFLKICNAQFSGGPEYLPNELRILKWHGYPSRSLPLNFEPRKIFVLNMCYSHIEQLWKSAKDLKNLKVIKLSHSINLTRTPEFSGMPNLEKLVLEGCTSLVEVHPSIGALKRLLLLNLKGCKNIGKFPSYIEMESLEILILSGCSKLEKFPEICGNMEHLAELSLDGTAVEELPLSIERLIGLVSLNLGDCKKLKSLPSIISSFKSLKILNLSGCSRLDSVPDNLGHVECLEELDVSGTAIRQPPSSITLLKKLQVLSFRGCNGATYRPWSSLLSYLLFPRSSMGLLLPSSMSGLCSLKQLDISDCNLAEGGLPSDLGSLSNLEMLNLSRNNFVSLPSSIRKLSKLKNLYLVSCRKLQSLPDLPSGLKFVKALGMVGNQSYTDIPVTLLKRYLQGLSTPKYRFDVVVPGSEISEWFNHQNAGSSIRVSIPSGWFNSQWMGFAACGVFAAHKKSTVYYGLFNDYNRGTHELVFHLKANGCTQFREPNFSFSPTYDPTESDHLWLVYLSRHRYFRSTNWHESCSDIELSFEAKGSGLEVKQCAFRLVYEHDIEAMNPTLIEYGESSNNNYVSDTLDVLQSFSDSATEKSTRKRNHDGGYCNFDEDAHSKRPKGDGSLLDLEAEG